ncbi:MAG: 30S ribosomal protein S11 [Candidatus Magasanikbacteria bacterium]|nr:30S ribosomal protein S11 [Candidatus Magasanikbacteria bacterium]
MTQQQAPIATAAISETKAPATGEKVVRAKKKKAVRQVPRGNVYIQATYNNTMISVTDPTGSVLGWSSAGANGFKGPKKATPYAASVVVKALLAKIADYGVREVSVFIKGIGGGRESAIRAFNLNGLNVLSITDTTPIPHNGCRPPKRRRV